MSFRALLRTAVFLGLCIRIATPLAAQTDEAAVAHRIADIAAVALDEYALGVADGRVINPAEYEEAVLFLGEAQRAAVALPLATARQVGNSLDAMLAAAQARRPVGDLRPLLEQVRASLTEGLGISLDATPRAVPSLAAGERVYRAQCVTCHGISGSGDGPQSAQIEPPPSDLTDRGLSNSSPLDFFRKINVGIAGTAMPGFQTLLDAEARWAVALYATGLRANETERRAGADVLRRDCPACLVVVSSFRESASLSDDSLAVLLAARLGREPRDSVTRLTVAFARTAGAAEWLGLDRRLEVARVTDQVKRALAGVRATADAGDREKAGRQALDAYLVFERVEAAVRARDAKAAADVEAGFARLRGTLVAGDVSEIDDALRAADGALTRALASYARASGSRLLFAQSLIIILREGFEAILIVGALMAFLSRAGAPKRRRDVGWGVAWAVGASLVTAAVFATAFRHATASQEVLEGITMLLAAVVLFWVSYWLVSKVEVKKWQAFVKSRMDRALSSRKALALAAVAFLAVYREGFETVLFYAALFASADGTSGAAASIGAGIVVGGALLGVVYFLMQRYGSQLPLKPFFAVTSGLLYLMAFTFAGQGVAELQEAGYLPVTPLGWVPRVPALGIFPTMQTLALQAVLAVALVGALVWVFWLEPRRTPGLKTS